MRRILLGALLAVGLMFATSSSACGMATAPTVEELGSAGSTP
ncbi:MAG TPA: hypothetical protein VHX65_00815 [Pirellulales bacterium]|nr:hypothetical protein [Pirellulales bacterium]